MTNECKLIEDLLPLYADNVCSKESEAKVEAHLLSCESCKSKLEILKSDFRISDSLIMENLQAKKPFKKIKAIWIITLIMVFVTTGAYGLLIKKNIEPMPPEEAPVAWAIEINGDIRDTYFESKEEDSSHLILGNQLIIRTTGANASITSIDFKTGEVLWSHELWKDNFNLAFIEDPETARYADWSVFEGMLIYPIVDKSTSKLFLEKLDTSSGEVLWQQPIGIDFDGEYIDYWSLERTDELLIVTKKDLGIDIADIFIGVFRINTGEMLYSLNGNAVQHEDWLYTISTDKPSSFKFSRYELHTGRKDWEVRLNVDPLTDLVMWKIDIKDTVLYSLESPDHKTVIAINNNNGEIIWEKDGYRIYGAAYDLFPMEDTVILSSEDQVLLVNRQTGAIIINYTMENPSIASRNGMVFISDKKTLMAIDISAANLLWETDHGGTVFAGHDNLYLIQEERLLAINMSTGSKLWEKQIKKPRLLLCRNDFLWLSSDTSEENNYIDPKKEILIALKPDSGEVVSTFDFEWWPAGPETWPIRHLSFSGGRLSFHYLTRLTLVNNEGQNYIALKDISNHKLINASTGEEMLSVESLQSYLAGSYSGYDTFFNIIYFFDEWPSVKQEFLVLDKNTMDVNQHFVGYGTPLNIIENHLFLAKRGENKSTLFSITLQGN